MLCLSYCLQQGPKHSFYILTLSTTTFFDYNTLSIYLLFLGLSQKPLPWLLVNKLLVLFFWHPKHTTKYTTKMRFKMRFIMRFNYLPDITKWFSNRVHIESFTTKMRFKYWFDITKMRMYIKLSHIQPKWDSNNKTHNQNVHQIESYTTKMRFNYLPDITKKLTIHMR